MEPKLSVVADGLSVTGEPTNKFSMKNLTIFWTKKSTVFSENVSPKASTLGKT